MIYIIIGIIIAGVLVIYFTSFGNKSAATDKQTSDQDTAKPKIHQTKKTHIKI